MQGWLKGLGNPVPAELRTPIEVARFELGQALPGMEIRLEERTEDGDGWQLSQEGDGWTLRGGETGVLYGAYHMILTRLGGGEIKAASSAPRYGLRMINCWDNMDGTVERGYAGRSLFFEGNRLAYDPDRMRELGRLLGSAGINVLCINNVNVHDPAQRLIEDFLPEVAELAGIFRAFGVRLMVSIDFSQPMRHGLGTADPLDAGVQQWWAETADRVYAAVPDLAGFLVKADSENRPGPFTYGRSHAEGANMLARALAPHGGVLVWRAFVYNCHQDWRDTGTDRPKAAYETYQPLDGQFDGNVILQVKHGPFDFQVREPLSPLLLSMEHTRLAMELQLAQEYTGHQIDIYAMPPMWQELFEELPADRLNAVAAVSNLGRDANFTGHPLAALNLYAFGQLAWNPEQEPEEVIRRWARLTYGFAREEEDRLTGLLMGSRRTYEKYTAPLGIGWMITPHTHYGPNPDGYEYDQWGTYHKANREAVGIDRTEAGTGFLSQYPAELQAKYGDPETCPELMLLFYHRVRYETRMKDGRTMIQRIYDDHFEGYEEAAEMAETLRGLPFPEPDRSVILDRAERQVQNAREWRDVINTFFYRLSGIEDEKGRKIWA